jgi:hypothetical protein
MTTIHVGEVPSFHSVLAHPKELAGSGDASCCRLYILAAFLPFEYAVSLQVANEDAFLHVEIVTNCSFAAKHPDWFAPLGDSSVPYSRAKSFMADLAELGIWDLPRPVSRVRDGIGFFHMAAEYRRYHSISFDNTGRLDDPAYGKIVSHYNDLVLQFHRVDLMKTVVKAQRDGVPELRARENCKFKREHKHDEKTAAVRKAQRLKVSAAWPSGSAVCPNCGAKQESMIKTENPAYPETFICCACESTF